MTRGNFLKSLFALAAAPNVIGELGVCQTSVLKPIGVGLINKSIISDLQLLTPHYYKQYLEKYGSENYTFFLENILS